MNSSAPTENTNSSDPFCPRVTLRIAGDGLDFDVITRTLGFSPSCMVRKGQSLEEGGPVGVTDAWIYQMQAKDRNSLSECLADLWSLLQPHAAYLRDLKRCFELVVSCNSMSRKLGPANLGGVRIASESLRLFTELGIPLNVGLIHFHNGPLPGQAAQSEVLPESNANA
jgi:hypothetical protein